MHYQSKRSVLGFRARWMKIRLITLTTIPNSLHTNPADSIAVVDFINLSFHVFPAKAFSYPCHLSVLLDWNCVPFFSIFFSATGRQLHVPGQPRSRRAYLPAMRGKPPSMYDNLSFFKAVAWLPQVDCQARLFLPPSLSPPPAVFPSLYQSRPLLL